MKKLKRQVISMILAALMILTSVPTAAFGAVEDLPVPIAGDLEETENGDASAEEPSSEDEPEPEESLQEEGEQEDAVQKTEEEVPEAAADGLEHQTPAAAQEVTVGAGKANVRMSMKQGDMFFYLPKTSEIPSNLAKSYGFTYGPNVSEGDITPLDALVQMHIDLYDVTKENIGDYLEVNSAGFITKLNGVSTSSIGFAVNGAMPHDDVETDYGYTGYSANDCVLRQDDEVEFFFYQDDYYLDNYGMFFADGEKVSSIEAEAGEDISLQLKGYCYAYFGNYAQSMIDQQTKAVEDAQLMLITPDAADPKGYLGTSEAVEGAVTDAGGSVTFQFDTAGTYYVSAKCDGEYDTPLVAPYLMVTVKEAAGGTLPELDAEWYDYRSSPDNMAITSAQTPVTAAETELKWGNKLGEGYSNQAVSSPILVDGYMYCYSGDKLLKIDKETGQVLASGKMAGNSSFSIVPPTYGGGMIFVGLSNGRIQAFNAVTLEALWVYQDELGGQPNSPIRYSDGYVYTGFWNSEIKDANYVCVRADAKTAESKSAEWKQTIAGGVYWAGAYVTERYVIVGTDDGERNYTSDTASLYSFDKYTGEVISRISGFVGDIRTDVAYDSVTDRVYFASKGGYLYSAKVSAEGVIDENSITSFALGGMSTSTPLIYNNRVYIGVSGASNFSPDGHSIKVLDLAADGTAAEAYTVPLTAYPQSSALLTTAYESDGYVYAYFTVNSKNGEIYVVKDKAGLTEADSGNGILYMPKNGMQQYCITSAICDREGTLYYKNDSGYMMALGANKAYLSDLTAEGGDAVMDQGEAFDGSAATHAVVVKPGTASVKLTASAPDGAVVSMNGTDGASLDISLTDGTAEVTVTVTCGDDSRSYTVAIRERAGIADLGNLVVTSSNAYTSGVLELSPAFDAETTEYSAAYDIDKSFLNVWPKAQDGNASITVMPVSGVSDRSIDEDGTIHVTAQNGGNSRYAVYFADGCGQARIKMAVTAEDGETVKEYYLTLEIPDETAPTLSDASVSGRNQNQATLNLNSSEAGTGYYILQAASLEAPESIDKAAARTFQAVQGANEVALEGVTKDAMALYIAVEDAAGNMSAILKLDLEEVHISAPTLETTLEDGMTQRGSRKTFDVIARDGDGNKISASVIFDGKTLSPTWNDTVKASYTLNFKGKEDGEYEVGIEATDADGQTVSKTYKINYEHAEDGELIGYATMGIEASTINCGYIIEPVKIPVYEGENSAHALTRLIQANGYDYSNTGSVDSGFYLSAILGANARRPKTATKDLILDASLNDDLKDLGIGWWEGTEGELGEFDYAQGSGWMYCLNNIFPNVGFADSYLSAGDVVRVQFTLAYGSDIGGGFATGGGDNGKVRADKDDLAEQIAAVNSAQNRETLLADAAVKSAYDEANAAMLNLPASQADVDAACEALKNAVTGDAPESIGMAEDNITLDISESRKLDLTYTPENIKVPVLVTWTSSDSSVVKVGTDGIVTAAGIGKATVTAEYAGMRACCEVTVNDSKDEEAAKRVMELISGIGNVTLDSEKAIELARGEYDQLTDKQKDLVTNLQTLEDAEDTLYELQEVMRIPVTLDSAKSVNYHTVDISWKPVNGAEGYRVYRKTAGGSFKAIANVNGQSKTSYRNTGLTTGTTYIYTVRALYKLDGRTQLGDYEKTGITGRPMPEKTALSKIQTWGYQALKVSWNKVDGANGYRVYYKASKNGSWKYAAQIAGGNSTSYVHNKLTAGKTYYYKVRAFRTVKNVKCFGAYSSELSGKPVPTQVKNVTVKKASSTSMKINWSKVNGASGYRIYRIDPATGKYKYVTQIGKGSTTSYTEKGLKKGAAYTYKMRAYRTVNGEKIFGAYSSAVNGSTK